MQELHGSDLWLIITTNEKIEGFGLGGWRRDAENAERYSKAVLKLECVRESAGRLVKTEYWDHSQSF